MNRRRIEVPRKWSVSLAVTLGLVALVWLVSVALAQEGDGELLLNPQGGSPTETFTYQGYLEDNGQPANGLYDFKFSVWDMAELGTQYGATMEFDDWITVEDGIFMAYLLPDDLTNVFTGGPRWLQIEVRPGDSMGPYTNLGRQPITPAPYAWGMRPFALISGDTGNASGFGEAVLNLDNTRQLSGGGNSSSLYARASTGSAVRGESGGVGVYGYSSWTHAVRGEAVNGTAGYFTTDEGYGLYAETNGTDHWDHGGYFSADMGYGVYGVSAHNYGVRGEGRTGVRGDGVSVGVSGSSATGSAVRGSSTSGYGVEGLSISTHGVHGRSDNNIGVVGVQLDYSEGDLGAGFYRPGGLFGGENGVVGITKESNGYGVFGWDKSTAGGWAGYFVSQNGGGVYISAPAPNQGLNVVSGSKNAVVRTDEGSRLLYSEESTEVWFSDYGFGQLQDGLAALPIDPTFAQTVNLAEPYHVFLQVYGDAEVYVADRTPTRFEVRLRDGDPNVEFSYRVVAKRLGYEGYRMEPAPWADDDPNLYPEKKGSLDSQQGGLQQPGGAP